MVAANKGAQSGWLVPLSAGLCYLGKQGSFMPKASISRLLFHRTGGSSSTFDITIKLQAAAASAAAGGGGGGKGGSRSLELGQIDAAELPKLQAYCMNQRIKVRVWGCEYIETEWMMGLASTTTQHNTYHTCLVCWSTCQPSLPPFHPHLPPVANLLPGCLPACCCCALACLPCCLLPADGWG